MERVHFVRPSHSFLKSKVSLPKTNSQLGSTDAALHFRTCLYGWPVLKILKTGLFTSFVFEGHITASM